VNGSKGLLTGPSNSKLEVGIKLGDFGEADPEIYKTTGQNSYNIEFIYTFGKDFIEPGVVSEDGFKITTKGIMGVTVLEWMSEKEAEAFEADADGDPIKAPPGPYKIQPDYLGKFLWITGAPGLGKSTSAQLLSKNYGYVYYEGDCFERCQNPYIPADVTNPTMAVFSQKPLKGEGLDTRMQHCKKAVGMFMEIFNGKEFDLEVAKEFYSCMCDDILSERKRIGGDWVIAFIAFTRNLRDHIR
jgi:hypothetical protein